MAGRPCRYPARAWWGGELIAECAAPVLLERDGTPALGFPVGDVRWELLVDDRTEGPLSSLGPARTYSLAGTAPDPRGAEWTGGDQPAVVEGDGAVTRYDELGLAVPDHDRLRVELVDVVAGEDLQHATVKRFPIWADAADLIALLDMTRAEDGSWVGASRDDEKRPVVEGSQLLGQAITAASRQVPGRRVVSAHLIFARAADARRQLRFALTEQSNGRSFTTIDVQIDQDARLRATGSLLLGAPARDLARHQQPAPPCAGPYESVPCDMGVTGRDIRVVDGAYTDDPDAPVGPPVIDAWVRFREVPLDPALHVGLLAQFTGHMSLAAAMRPHAGIGQAQAHRTISTGINAIHLAVHADIRMDRWVRYHHRSTVSSGGMTHSECQVYDEAGLLLASFTVEAMLRPFAAEGAAMDPRTAL